MERAEGVWAVVTGAASGIGRAVACRLAECGYNIFAADRNLQKLHETRNVIVREYGVDVVEYEVDLARWDAAEELFGECCRMELDVRVLVNDAGMFIYNDVADTDPQRIDAILALHVRTVTMLCRLFGARMVSNGEGWILNMSSYSIWMPFPGLTLYSATKAYIKAFSRTFSREMRPCGVKVTAVSPAGVATDFYGLNPKFQRLGRRLGVLMTPDRIARIALRTLFHGRRHKIPGWYYRLLIPLFDVLPDCFVRFIHRKTSQFRH